MLTAFKNKFSILFIILDLHDTFQKVIIDLMRSNRSYCNRTLLQSLKSAKEIVYTLGIIDEVCKFACKKYNDNYFLLRVCFLF